MQSSLDNQRKISCHTLADVAEVSVEAEAMAGKKRDAGYVEKEVLLRLIERIIRRRQRAFLKTRLLEDRESLPILEVVRELRKTLAKKSPGCRIAYERIRQLLVRMKDIDEVPVHLFIIQEAVRCPALVRDARKIINSNFRITQREFQETMKQAGRPIGLRLAVDLLCEIRGNVDLERTPPKPRRRS